MGRVRPGPARVLGILILVAGLLWPQAIPAGAGGTVVPHEREAVTGARGAAAWAPVLPVQQQALQYLSAFPDGTGYVLDRGGFNTLWRTGDYGLTWNPLTQLPPCTSSSPPPGSASPWTPLRYGVTAAGPRRGAVGSGCPGRGFLVDGISKPIRSCTVSR